MKKNNRFVNHHARSTPNFQKLPRQFNTWDHKNLVEKTVFKPYWNLDDVTKGLAEGELVQVGTYMSILSVILLTSNFSVILEH